MRLLGYLLMLTALLMVLLSAPTAFDLFINIATMLGASFKEARFLLCAIIGAPCAFYLGYILVAFSKIRDKF